jgi:hypothetical protein
MCKNLNYSAPLIGAIAVFPGAFCMGMDYAESDFYKRRRKRELGEKERIPPATR